MVEVRSMDDERIYGRVAYRLPMVEAARRGIITDLKLVIVLADPAVADGLARASRTDTDDVVHLVALRRFARQYGLSKIFTFHRTVAAARRYTALSREIPADPEWEAALEPFHVNGNMNAVERAALLTRFENAACAQLSSVRCMTEGVDVPAVDAVALMTRKGSKVDIVQICGHAIRKSDQAKDCAYLMLPLVVGADPRTGLENALSSEQLRTVLEVVGALQEADDNVDAALCALRRERGGRTRRGPLQLHPRITFDGPTHLLDALRASLVDHVVTRLTSTWEEYFGALEACAATNGHPDVPDGYLTAGGLDLAKWLTGQRRHARSDRLPGQRKDSRLVANRESIYWTEPPAGTLSVSCIFPAARPLARRGDLPRMRYNRPAAHSHFPQARLERIRAHRYKGSR